MEYVVWRTSAINSCAAVGSFIVWVTFPELIQLGSTLCAEESVHRIHASGPRPQINQFPTPFPPWWVFKPHLYACSKDRDFGRDVCVLHKPGTLHDGWRLPLVPGAFQTQTTGASCAVDACEMGSSYPLKSTSEAEWNQKCRCSRA